MSYNILPVSPSPVTNFRGKALSNVRVIVDYHQDETNINRYGALLQIYDYTVGGADTVKITPSDSSQVIWTEGTDFDASVSDSKTAQNIASTINATSGFTAEAVTGHAYDPYVSVTYTAGGYLDSATSGDGNAWEFQTVNTTNGTIASVVDANENFKPQPLFTDSDGYWSCFVDNKGSVDYLYSKDAETFDNSRRENVSLGGDHNPWTEDQKVNGYSLLNTGLVEVGRISSGTTKPSTQDTFELQIDTDTGTNGELYMVWNDNGTKRTISLGTT